MSLKTCLFGGALIAAGLHVTEASAQSFLNTGGLLAGAYGYDYSSGDSQGAYTYGFTLAPAGSGSMALADGSTASWAFDSGAGRWDIAVSKATTNAYAVANMASIFNIASNLRLEISWDFRNADLTDTFTSEFAWFVLESDDASFTQDEIIDAFDPDSPSLGLPSSNSDLFGTATIQLDAGKTYQLALDLFTTDGTAGGQDGFISARLVPTPGAIAVLGTAGLFASRRRR